MFCYMFNIYLHSLKNIYIFINVYKIIYFHNVKQGGAPSAGFVKKNYGTYAPKKYS